MLWLVGGAFLLVWLIALVLGKGGFIHLLLLCAIATLFIEILATYRASQESD
jgi:hypothetical protein